MNGQPIKLNVLPATMRLELTVTKQQGPVTTTVEVASTGPDDQSFFDNDLTPGPAIKALDPANSYSLVWTGAFAAAGSVDLRMRVLDAQGNVIVDQVVPVQGNAGDVFFRIVVIP